jgi:hypothetical protein
MMARRIAYSLISVFGVLLAIGSALGAGMMTFTSEQKAQQHCPSDTVVWLNTTNANLRFNFPPDNACACARELAVEWRDINGLVPYARNARTHSEAQIAQIAGPSKRYRSWSNWPAPR